MLPHFTNNKKHNFTQFYNTFAQQESLHLTQLYTSLQHSNMFTIFYNTLQGSTTTLHKLSKLFQNIDTNLQHTTQLYKNNVPSFTKLYNTQHNFTQLYENKFTTLYHFTTLCQPIHKCTTLSKTLQHFYTTLHDSTQFHTTFQTSATSYNTFT